MIFKRFFKPKWQHNDAAIRQQAIAQLNATTPEQKSVLHELAFNDAAEAVRRSALLKLNDFSLYWQASKQDTAERLQQFAEQQLINMLLQNKVEAKLKQQFIAQCNRGTILEQLALTETDAEVKFDLLQRLNKPEFTLKALQHEVLTDAHKQKLIDQVTDEKQLEKLSRQLDGSLQHYVRQKIAVLAEQKQLPGKLRKDITLLLAKLNAARDKYSLQDLPAQLAEYQQQWQQLEPMLDCLGSEAADFRSKYQKLQQQLQDWLTPRLAELAAEQAAQARRDAMATKRRDFVERIDVLREQLQQALVSADINAAEQLQLQLKQLANDINDSDIADSHELIGSINKLLKQLQDLPQQAELLTKLTRLIADWAAQPVPESAQAYAQLAATWQQWQQDWRQISKQLSIGVPESLQQAKEALQQQWQQASNIYTAESQKIQRQCRSKLAQYRRLYQAGKYKVLFGLFKGIEADYQQLSEPQQQQLQKDFQFACDKMAELADWQEYIATPRKQELLAKIQQLDNQVADEHIRQRAAEIKQARAQWNTLGKADPALEQQLNTAFDEACEAAFAPCRAYFAAQDAQRAIHVSQRQEIIAELEQLRTEQIKTEQLSGEQGTENNTEKSDTKQLETKLAQLQQMWQKAGAVDKAEYNRLLEQYQAVLKPLKQQLQQQYDAVAQQKQQLIDKAQSALLLDDANLTAKVLKECQQQWKALGFAGRKQDQQLWQQFRAICDGFFSARSEQFTQQKHAEQQQQQRIELQLDSLTSQLELLTTLDQLNEFEQQLRSIEPATTGNQKTIKLLLEKLKLKRQQISQQQKQAETEALFDTLASPSVSAEQLPAEYREYFANGLEKQLSRHQLTLALEIVSAVPSPEAEQQDRQQVQLILLSDKHNQGQALDKDSLLKRWLQFGPVNQDEMTLLTRVKQAFMA